MIAIQKYEGGRLMPVGGGLMGRQPCRGSAGTTNPDRPSEGRPSPNLPIENMTSEKGECKKRIGPEESLENWRCQTGQFIY
jgi:hypothetical protein